MPDCWIFSYGTLRQPDVQRAIFQRELRGEDDCLTGFRVGIVKISDPDVAALSGSAEHPGLIRTGNPADRVAGTAFAVTDSELASADAYEAADYARHAVTLASGKTAFVYLARS
ncbi:MAG: gamma-glutamylcyclotransferase family protein [Sphingomicrobium sp.]